MMMRSDASPRLRIHRNLSFVTLAASVALLIAGIVGSTTSVPDQANASAQWEQQRTDVQELVALIAMLGCIPGAGSLVFSILGIFGAQNNHRTMLIVHCVFAILLVIAHALGTFWSLFAASNFHHACSNLDSSTTCSGSCLAEINSFCTQFTDALWAAFALGFACVILNFALAISSCCLTCCGKDPAPQDRVPLAAGYYNDQQVPIAYVAPPGTYAYAPVVVGNVPPQDQYTKA